jgi:DNA-binding transcriptional MerR regulator
MGETRLAWTSRRLADLAGVTVRTLRHYHQIGLLPEPDRTAGGYRMYGPGNLLMVVRIRRLVRAGLSLGRIGELLTDPEDVTADTALEEVDCRLAEEIEELQARRRVIASLMDAGRVDLPPRYALAVDAMNQVGTDDAAIDEVKDLVELIDGLGAEADKEAATAAMDAFALDPELARLVELDRAVRRIDESTPDEAVDRVVDEVVAAVIGVAERGLAAAATVGMDVPAGMNLGDPLTDLVLAWAEAGLSPRARDAYRRVLTAVADHFDVDTSQL